jgi:glycosyltransferase involved in cell wall biosynthesis
MDTIRVVAVAVVYGSRWPFLKEVMDATLLVVDNGSHNPELIRDYADLNQARVMILRQEHNLGFSSAIAKGLAEAQKIEGDYVIILDDDSVPEVGAFDWYLENMALFDAPVVLCANRIDVPGNSAVFRQRPFRDRMPKGTIFEVFSFVKLFNALKLLFRIHPRAEATFIPIVPAEAFVTGGTFLPMEVVRKAPLPDGRLFIYGEDLEYSWKIRRMGYPIYVCARPIIRDIDMTFPSQGYHIFGLFDEKTPAYKVFFRMRNSVIISKRNTTQAPLVLLINIVFWYVGLAFIGMTKTGFKKIYFIRLLLIGKALYRGFRLNFDIPAEVVTPR